MKFDQYFSNMAIKHFLFSVFFETIIVSISVKMLLMIIYKIEIFTDGALTHYFVISWDTSNFLVTMR